MNKSLGDCKANWLNQQFNYYKYYTQFFLTNTTNNSIREAEDINKRLQEYTEELYKKDLHDSDNHDDLITHVALDILECEVK